MFRISDAHRPISDGPHGQIFVHSPAQERGPRGNLGAEPSWDVQRALNH